MNAERLLEVYEQISEAPDAIARLRRFVLDLAVRGKLVEQVAGDEPASRLIENIARERAASRTDKKGKAKEKSAPVPFAGELYDLPIGWSWSPLIDLSDVTMGQSPPGSTYNKSGDGVPLINGPVEFTDGPFGATVVNQYTTEPTNFCEADDFLICVRGSTTGRTNVAAFRACIGRGVAAVRSTFEDGFIRLFLWKSREDIIGMGRGIAFPSVSKKQLEQLAIPLPPLAEQHRIVAKVDELMALCDRLEEARKTREELRDKLTAASLVRLTAPDTTAEDFPAHAAFALDALPALTTRPDQIKILRQTILNLAVRGKLVEQDAGDKPAAELLEQIRDEKAERVAAGLMRTQKPLEPVAPNEREFDLPHNWVWVRLGEVVKLWNGLAFKSSDFGTVGIPVIRIGDLKGGVVNITSAACVSEKIASQASEEVWIPNGALLLAMSGATTGKTAFNKTGQRLLLNQRVGRIEPFQMNIHFIRFFFETIIARNLSISLGTAIPNLSAKQVNETAIPLPPLAEQHRIVAKVDALMALCDRLAAALTTTDTTRTRLLEALLREALEPASDSLEAAE
ncbi:restriction endonuclease subunit S [Pseudohalocynthiibacter aestuariivivens]|nr:restriction endonuclease subunit S [Pseudohalocynthiibacter aestuariivivens]QIE44890.1 restriction endonuclease subunit S [Pseudohalocynthiibacter aestuariivivens]